MKMQATQLHKGLRVRLDGLRNYHGEDISRRFYTLAGVVRRSISVVLVFEPSEDGPPETVTVPLNAAIVVHRGSIPRQPAAAPEASEPRFVEVRADELRVGDSIIWAELASGPVVVAELVAIHCYSLHGIPGVTVLNSSGGQGFYSAGSLVMREVSYV